MSEKVKIGDRFGRFTIEGTVKRNHRTLYVCRCDCGNVSFAMKRDLLLGKTRSCGCLKNELFKERITTHEMSDSKTYHSWCAMKERCNNKNSHAYPLYGGRGIKICERWENSFKNFISDMGICPDGCSIDRIDPNGDYSPNNCRWATYKEQGRNTRRNVFINYKGEDKTIAEVAEILNINYRTLYYRIFAYGWPVEKAINTPVNITHRRKTAPWNK